MLAKKIYLLLIAMVSLSFCYTYTAWTTMTGNRTLAIAPTIWGGGISDFGSSTLDINTAFGIGERFDAIVNLSKISPLNDFSWGGVEVMPRFALNESNVLALKIGTDFDNWSFSPQYHLNKEFSKVVLELNAALDLSASDFSEGTVWASFGIVYKSIPDQFYPFLEFNPAKSYGTAATAITFSIDPGFWFGIKETPHNWAISFPISGIKEKDISVGLNAWYWWSFEY